MPPINRGLPVTPYLNSSTPICLYTIHYHGATMMIKGSLQASIPIVMAFLMRNWPKICVLGVKWGQNVNFCFRTPKRHILMRNDIIWRTDCKISAGGFSVRCRQNQKKLAESLCTRWRDGGEAGAGSKNPLSDCNEILHRGRCPQHHPCQILRPSDQRFGGEQGVKFPSFPLISIDFRCRI